jgi:hypothetical protein
MFPDVDLFKVSYLQPSSAPQKMLSHRSCSSYGRHTRISADILPPLCPACRLPPVPPPFKTRPCLNCQIPIRIDAPDILCPRCLSRSADDYIRVSQNIQPCYDCTNPFPARPGVIHYFNCRTRWAQPVQAIPAFDTASFNPFINTFQPFAIQPRLTLYLLISQDSQLCYDCYNPFLA